ncbi:MAG: YggS family pyridoxal phosphate-dependent enzyme [Sediminicola sp.]
MSIKENIAKIRESLPEGVVLVAVSKTKPVEDLQQAYDAGQRIFGENKIQEMTEKWSQLPKDIEWHMIGHVQSNKVKYMAPYVHLVHGVDSLKLLKELNKQAKKNNRTIAYLLQLHIAEEDTKFGLDEKELQELLHSDDFLRLQHVQLLGLMGMATFTENRDQIRREFSRLKGIFDRLRTGWPDLSVLSMGMSADHKIALEEGSTMVRIGSDIFGERNHH